MTHGLLNALQIPPQAAARYPRALWSGAPIILGAKSRALHKSCWRGNSDELADFCRSAIIGASLSLVRFAKPAQSLSLAPSARNWSDLLDDVLQRGQITPFLGVRLRQEQDKQHIQE